MHHDYSRVLIICISSLKTSNLVYFTKLNMAANGGNWRQLTAKNRVAAMNFSANCRHLPPIAAIGDKKNSNFVSNLPPNIEIDVFMRGTSDVGDTELFFGKLVPLIYSTLTETGPGNHQTGIT